MVGAGVVSQLNQLGWRLQVAEGGFAAGQPQFNFVIPLRHEDGTPRTEDEVLTGMNQQWRRNIKKAAKEGVEVVRGTIDDLALFHELYVHTAQRDHFTPRPLGYFRTMFEALGSEGGEDPTVEIRLYLARHEALSSPRPSGSGSGRTAGTPTAPPPPRSARCAARTPPSGR